MTDILTTFENPHNAGNEIRIEFSKGLLTELKLPVPVGSLRVTATGITLRYSIQNPDGITLSATLTPEDGSTVPEPGVLLRFAVTMAGADTLLITFAGSTPLEITQVGSANTVVTLNRDGTVTQQAAKL